MHDPRTHGAVNAVMRGLQGIRWAGLKDHARNVITNAHAVNRVCNRPPVLEAVAVQVVSMGSQPGALCLVGAVNPLNL
jgi:hypothetical protein